MAAPTHPPLSPPHDASMRTSVPAGSSRPDQPPPATRRTRVWALITGLIVSVVTAWGAATAPTRSDDEGTYVSQALAVLDGHLSPYTYWYDHPPLGWILIAPWMAGPGAVLPADNPIVSARYLMVLVAGVTAALIVALIRRLDGSLAAATVAGLAFGLSPLAIEHHRMVLLDNLAVMFLLLAWVLACARSPRLSTAIASGLALSGAILCKETLLLVAPFVVWSLVQHAQGPIRAMSVTLFGLAVAVPGAVYALFAALKGELLPGDGHVSLATGVSFQLFDRAGSGSVFDPASDAHGKVMDWLTTDPYLLVIGALSAPILLVDRRRWPLFGACVVSVATLLRTGYLPAPYVIVLVPLAAVAVGFELSEGGRLVATALGRLTGRRWTKAVAIVVVGAMGVAAAVVAIRPVTTLADTTGPLLTQDQDSPYPAAVDWLNANVTRGQTVVCDNVVWTDLVERDGWPQTQVIWFTKLDVDPEVVAKIPTWQEADYLVVSDIVRADTTGAVLADIQAHSREVARWGSGQSEISIRQVEH